MLPMEIRMYYTRSVKLETNYPVMTWNLIKTTSYRYERTVGPWARESRSQRVLLHLPLALGCLWKIRRMKGDGKHDESLKQWNPHLTDHFTADLITSEWEKMTDSENLHNKQSVDWMINLTWPHHSVSDISRSAIRKLTCCTIFCLCK